MVKVQCEKCSSEHEGVYGSGRFCSAVCARGFSTSSRREEISAKVSERLKARNDHSRRGTPESRRRQAATCSENWRNKLLVTEFSSLSLIAKKKRVVIEQEGKCFKCGIDEWLGEKLTLQVDHVDGDTGNNGRENLRGLCPNCHSLTPTYCGHNRPAGSPLKVIDEILLSALLTSKSMTQALAKVGYPRAKRHFDRCKRLLRNHNGGLSYRGTEATAPVS